MMRALIAYLDLSITASVTFVAVGIIKVLRNKE